MKKNVQYLLSLLNIYYKNRDDFKLLQNKILHFDDLFFRIDEVCVNISRVNGRCSNVPIKITRDCNQLMASLFLLKSLSSLKLPLCVFYFFYLFLFFYKMRTLIKTCRRGLVVVVSTTTYVISAYYH